MVTPQYVSVRRVWQSLSFYSWHAHSCYMHVFVAGRHGQTQCQTNLSSGFSPMDLSERCRPIMWSSVIDASSSNICTRDRPPIYTDTGRPYTWNEGETLRDRHSRTQTHTRAQQTHTHSWRAQLVYIRDRDWSRDRDRVICCGFTPSPPLQLYQRDGG